MNLLKVALALFLIIAVNACSTNESKIKAIINKEVGEPQLVERSRLELENILGDQDSNLKNSVLDYVHDNIEVKFTEVIVDGKRARVSVKAVVPRVEEVSSLMLISSYLPKEKILKMSLEELLAEASKGSRQPASQMQINSDTYEFTVDFYKEKSWVPNMDQLRKAFNKRNLISKK